MKLLLTRVFFLEDRTIGRLFIDDLYFCDTLEDQNRDLNHNGDFDNGEKKIYSKTCIPFGEYKVTIDVVSPKFSKKEFYKKSCKGKLPRLLNVPYFEGILIHCAEGPKGPDLLEGCIGIGNITAEWYLEDCQTVFNELYAKLEEARKNKETITLEIV